MTASRRDGPASQEVSSAPTRLSVAALAKRRLAATLTDLAALGPHLSKKKRHAMHPQCNLDRSGRGPGEPSWRFLGEKGPHFRVNAVHTIGPTGMCMLSPDVELRG